MSRNFFAKKYYSNLSFTFIDLTGMLSKIDAATEDDLGKYDNSDQARQFGFDRTRDPVTGTVPRKLLVPVMEYTDSVEVTLPFQLIAGYGTRTERGPN